MLLKNKDAVRFIKSIKKPTKVKNPITIQFLRDCIRIKNSKLNKNKPNPF